MLFNTKFKYNLILPLKILSPLDAELKLIVYGEDSLSEIRTKKEEFKRSLNSLALTCRSFAYKHIDLLEMINSFSAIKRQ